MNLEQIKTLSHGDILEHISVKNADGTPARCRVTGKLKLWKTRPEDFKLPVKHGLYESFYITPDNATDWNVQ
jgi:hypothetical protein